MCFLSLKEQFDFTKYKTLNINMSLKFHLHIMIVLVPGNNFSNDKEAGSD